MIFGIHSSHRMRQTLAVPEHFLHQPFSWLLTMYIGKLRLLRHLHMTSYANLARGHVNRKQTDTMSLILDQF
ncbi:hypothetical protein ACH3XW_9595 [Acanthocheilonema viteae]